MFGILINKKLYYMCEYYVNIWNLFFFIVIYFLLWIVGKFDRLMILIYKYIILSLIFFYLVKYFFFFFIKGYEIKV